MSANLEQTHSQQSDYQSQSQFADVQGGFVEIQAENGISGHFGLNLSIFRQFWGKKR